MHCTKRSAYINNENISGILIIKDLDVSEE